MEELRFACTACGKCCTEPPEMTVLEATRLGDVFVASLVYRLTSIPKDDNEAALASLKPHPHFSGVSARELVARLRETTAVRAAGAVVSEAGWDHHIALTARPWTYETQACTALAADGKRCSVHDRRPHTCRTVPIRYDVPEGLLVRAFRGVVDAGRASSDPFECDVSAAAPMLLRDGVLVSDEYSAARAAGIEAALGERLLASRILESPFLPPLKEVYATLRRARVVSVSFHGALATAHEMGLLDDAAVDAFAAAQLSLIDRELARAMTRKRKEDREITARFRTLVTAYEMMRTRLAARSSA